MYVSFSILDRIFESNSPLTTSAHQQQTPRSMDVTPIVIEMGRKGYGMTLKPIRVYIGDSNNYRIHHIVQVMRITVQEIDLLLCTCTCSTF